MPIFSRRFSLWTRLYGRMLLEPTADVTVTPMVSEVVVPVIDADKILETPVISANVGNDLTGTSGTYVAYFTVPSGEEWALISGKKSPTTGTTRGQVSIGGVTLDVLVDSTSAELIDYKTYILREGDSAGLTATGNGADSDRYLQIGYSLVSLDT